jgi:putative tricarboxylic transport membrane protein
LVVAAALPCAAQTGWKPDRTVEVVVGSAAGGGNDRTARTMQRIWQEAGWLDKAVVVNKVGGGGALAYTYTAQHPGDAHTIAVARTGLLTNHILARSKLTLADVTPLAMVADDAMSLTVRANSTIKTLKDLIARWKADPQAVSISLGSSRGSTTHFLVALLAKSGGVDPRPLKVLTFGGGADSVTNLLGGHIDMVSLGLGNVAEHHKSGKLRVLGVASEKRSAALPDVPTLKEQGFPVVQGGWTAIIGPRDLAPAQVAYWESLLERTVNHATWKRSLEQDYAEWVFMKSQPTRDFLKKDYETARALLTELGMAK